MINCEQSTKKFHFCTLIYTWIRLECKKVENLLLFRFIISVRFVLSGYTKTLTSSPSQDKHLPSKCFPPSLLKKSFSWYFHSFLHLPNQISLQVNRRICLWSVPGINQPVQSLLCYFDCTFNKSTTKTSIQDLILIWIMVVDHWRQIMSLIFYSSNKVSVSI